MRHLALYHGVIPLFLKFDDDMEETIDAALRELVLRGHLSRGRLVAVVQSGRTPIWRKRHTHAIQVCEGHGARARARARWGGFRCEQGASCDRPHAGAAPHGDRGWRDAPGPAFDRRLTGRRLCPVPACQVRRVGKRHVGESQDLDSIEEL
jgi:hypothetical protein